MSIDFIKGNIFNSKAQTIVNTVNCVGAMGKGIAFVYKLRYPGMYEIYKKHCEANRITPGVLWLYKSDNELPWVLNFPTKVHWKYPSKIEYLELGLTKFVNTFRVQGIESIAFPLLGAHNGGLKKEEVIYVMQKYLAKCDIPIEIYEYDYNAPDNMYQTFSQKWRSSDFKALKQNTGMRRDRIELIHSAITQGKVYSMIQLIELPGIGIKTMERCFDFVMSVDNQQTLNLDS